MLRVVGKPNVISPLQLNVMVSPALSEFAWLIAAARLDASRQELTVMVDAAYVGRGELVPAIPSARSITSSIRVVYFILVFLSYSVPIGPHPARRLMRPRGVRWLPGWSRCGLVRQQHPGPLDPDRQRGRAPGTAAFSASMQMRVCKSCCIPRFSRNRIPHTKLPKVVPMPSGRPARGRVRYRRWWLRQSGRRCREPRDIRTVSTSSLARW